MACVCVCGPVHSLRLSRPPPTQSPGLIYRGRRPCNMQKISIWDSASLRNACGRWSMALNHGELLHHLLCSAKSCAGQSQVGRGGPAPSTLAAITSPDPYGRMEEERLRLLGDRQSNSLTFARSQPHSPTPQTQPPGRESVTGYQVHLLTCPKSPSECPNTPNLCP